MSQPRGATSADKEQLRTLVGKVFRPSLYDEYPQLFHDENLENCRVVEDDGKLVTHIGMTIQDAAIYGCRVTVANIGAVSTDPDYRGKGYATASFADAATVAREKGGDYMMISGDRKLYRLAGCRSVGLDYQATMTLENAFQTPSNGVTLRLTSSADIPILAALEATESLRWFRSPATWERAFECGFVMNRESDFWLVEKSGDPWGYFIVNRVDANNPRSQTPGVSEFAGDRRLLLSGFAKFVRARSFKHIRWHLSGSDVLGLAAARSAGARLDETHTAGTHLIVNFSQLMERLRPYVAERVGSATANRLRFESDGDACEVSYDGETFRLPNRGCAAHFVFGTREDRPTSAPQTGALAEIYRAAFPVPPLWYGINYV